jgi:glycosyltransferase involved in cell wall biosynthesis
MKESKRVLVSCGTKFHSDYMAAQLEKHQLLEGVVTAHPASRFLNRAPVPRDKVSFLPPVFTLVYVLDKLRIRSKRLHDFLNYRLPLLYDRLASGYLRKANISITWAWAGLRTIRAVKKRGGIAIVEECGSCNLHQNELLAGEYQLLGLQFRNRTPEFIVQRELEELRLADIVLCPSNYVARSFEGQGIPAAKFKIIPYGANLGLFRPVAGVQRTEFTILFVGTIGVRKGLIYLFRALRELQKTYPVKCLLIGRVEDQFQPIFRQYADSFVHIPRVDHQELAAYYSRASVFVFPSLDEGMAYVQLEAMACALPVICTFNSGGDSIITDGADGFVVPVKDEAAIVDRVEFLYLNPQKRDEMARQALEKAKQFSWDAYGEKLANLINSL